jgi:predicted phage-related endonuclease
MYKASQEAAEKHAADVAAAAERGKLLDAARAADKALREAAARRAPVTELHRLAKELDAALTAAMRAAYAAQRAEIGPRGYEDRIYARKARAKPAVRTLTAEAERLLTLRENHRMNHIPDVPREPAV